MQSLSDKDVNGKVIPIPRTEDKASSPVTLYFDAKTDEWRNITEVFKNDHVVVSLLPDNKTTAATSTVYNSLQNGAVSADCREGKRSYNPICGRYSIWDSSSTYVSSCRFVAECYLCNPRRVCKGWNILGVCIKGYKTVYDWCSCYKNNYGTAPEPYANDGKYTSPWYSNISSLMTNFARDCRTEHSYVDGTYQNKKYFWFSADNAAGLLYRFDNNINPTSAKSRGSNYNFAKIQDDQSFHTADENYKIIMNTIYAGSDVGYLQYRFHDNDGLFADNTGGYVLNIKQTKCRRANGNGFNDVIQGRGIVQYIIADYGRNPNNDNSLTEENILVDNNGSGSITAPTNKEGYLWLKIKNDPNDYQDSFGQYQVQFFTSVRKGGFYDDVLDPFFEGLKGKIKDAAVTIFKNMTCYKGIGGSGNCTNFFQYIKALLILYIMLYGMMFLMGMVQISQTDLVIRVIKVGLVAGLINDSTFEFFNSYVFDFVTGFSDDIISNMAGYSLFSGSTTVSNPFMFLNEVMTKIFLSSTFAAQMMAMLSMGLNGILYFILLFVCIGIIIIVAFRAIAVYLMAFMAIAVLIGLAPLFLTFILFQQTWYLFDNWVKFMFRYMLEPIIMLAGIIILTQLFTIYLDYVVGYSVCWKCGIPIKIPFPQIEGVTPAFLDVELFCINWFAPWGFDHRSSQMGMNMQNMVVLLMIAYCMWGYIDFSNKIVARLAGGSGGPSATSMGGAMSRAIEQKALSKVGLDSQSRAAIKNSAKERAKSMRKGDKKAPLSTEGRKDKQTGGTQDPKTGSGTQQSTGSQAISSSTAQQPSSSPVTSSPGSWQSVKPSSSVANKQPKVKIGQSRTQSQKANEIDFTTGNKTDSSGNIRQQEEGSKNVSLTKLSTQSVGQSGTQSQKANEVDFTTGNKTMTAGEQEDGQMTTPLDNESKSKVVKRSNIRENPVDVEQEDENVLENPEDKGSNKSK